MQMNIYKELEQGFSLKEQLCSDKYVNLIEKVSIEIVNAYKSDNKVLLCGNGGSMSDCLHIEGE